MQYICQLTWKETKGQMEKMKRKAAAKPLILACGCKSPLLPGSAQAAPLEMYWNGARVGFLQNVWLFWLLHSETFHTVHSRWELGSSAQALKFAYICIKIYIYMYAVHVSLDPGRAPAGGLSMGYVGLPPHQAQVQLGIPACPWHTTWAGALHQQMDARSQMTLNSRNHCWALSLQTLQQSKPNFSHRMDIVHTHNLKVICCGAPVIESRWKYRL